MDKPKLLLLTRPECHLCEEFREELEAAFPDRLSLREACVDENAIWRAAYGNEIPVLLDERGLVVCKTRFNAGVIGKLLHAKKTP